MGPQQLQQHRARVDLGVMGMKDTQPAAVQWWGPTLLQGIQSVYFKLYW